MTATVVTVIACGIASSAVAAGRNPCQLVTAADVEQALGALVGAPKLQTLGLYRSCTYVTRTGKFVTVQTRQISRPVFVKSAKGNPGPVIRITGLGAEAYWAGRSVLLVWKNGTEVTFLVIGVSNALAVEKQLAVKAVKRL